MDKLEVLKKLWGEPPVPPYWKEGEHFGTRDRTRPNVSAMKKVRKKYPAA